MINKVLLSGRLTSDCFVKDVGGQSVNRFSIASNRKYGEKEKTIFVDCDLWGERGKTLQQWLVKGKEVFVEGRLEIDKWTKDGITNSKTYIVVDNIEFLGSIKKDGEQCSTQQN